MGTVHRRRSERAWEGVAAQAYDDPSLAGVEKHELIGPADGAPHYRVRYFHVPAGGRTARERHAHDHGVVIQRGRARVTLGDEVHEVGEGDVVSTGLRGDGLEEWRAHVRIAFLVEGVSE